ncbi:MAG: tyrosine-type recombinase/integrase [Candidatus Bathyarchaeia archaeon]
MSSSTEPQEDYRDDLNDCSASVQGKPYGSNGPEVQCPLCGSKRLFKDGFRKLVDGSKIQRYLCRDCGYRFTISSSRRGKTHETSDLNRPNGYVKDEGHEDLSRSDMGCVALMEKPPQTVKKPAGGTVSQDVLTGFALWLLKNGRREETVKKNVEVVRMLIRKGANIYDPEAVKEFINKLNISEDTKMNYANLYGNFVRFYSGSWEKPKYGKTEKIPFIPTEEELDMLIARCGRKTAAFLQFLKETGVRVGEALMVKWADVDFERKIVNITPEKRSKGRILPISDRLVEILKSLPRDSERVFSMTRESIESSFMRQRNSLALKLKNPRLKRITLHTFRHWKATMEYHKTKDIVYVKELLGHKSIQNTMIYINIERALFQTPKDEFYCKTASTIDEASKLIEAGFEYVTTFNGIMLFRKRK